MDNKKTIFKNIFLTVGNSTLAAGVAGLSTTSLPYVLPAVLVGSFWFQVLQHLWAKRREGMEFNTADLSQQIDALKEALSELGFHEKEQFEQFEQCLMWLCKGLEYLGDRVQLIENGLTAQAGTIDDMVTVIAAHENAIAELKEIFRQLNAPTEIIESLIQGAGSLSFCIHNLPFPSIRHLLKGRETEMKQLLDGEGASAITQTIQGLGGIGKSRLAVEFGWKAVYDGSHKAVFFVTADSKESLTSNLALLTKDLNLPEKKAKEQEIQYEAVLRWFKQNDKWLLILDNVDEDKAVIAVQKLLPQLSNGRVLITSRNRAWGAAIQILQLEILTEDDSVNFLFERTLQRSKTEQDDIKVRELAKLLDGLPLALEQAAAYINVRSYTFENYLSNWEKDSQKVLQWSSVASGVPISVAITWNKTWEILSTTAKAIMRIGSILAPKPIPIDFVVNSEDTIKISCCLLEEVYSIPDQVDIDDALSELVKYSMIKRDGASFSIHRIVREVIKIHIPIEEYAIWVQVALNIIDEYIPSDPPFQDVRSWNIWGPMHTHVAIIIDESNRLGIVEQTSRLMYDLGSYYYTIAVYSKAESLYHRALTLVEKSYGPDHPSVAIRLNWLVQLLMPTIRHQDAEPLMRRAFVIDEKPYGPDHPTEAILLANLAQLLYTTNRLLEAEPLMRLALEIDEKSYGPDHPVVATDLNNLALLLQDTDRLQEAEPLMRRALTIDEKSYGSDQPKVAIRLSKLAQLLKDTNRLQEAEPLIRRVLEIAEKSYSPDHPDLNKLATLLKATNRLQEAEPLMRRALAIDEKSYGSDHPEVAIKLNNLASIEFEKGNKPETERLLNKALEIYRKSFDDSHPYVQKVLKNLKFLKDNK